MGSADLRLRPGWRLFFWCLVVLAGVLQIWARRHYVNPDTISYIEIAQQSLRSGISGLINAYWSPLYPALLAVALRVFHPAPLWESTVTHLVSLPLILLNLACFEVFLRELLRAQHAPESDAIGAPLPPQTMWILGYTFFLWSGQFWLGWDLTSPDVLVSAAGFLATALLLRIVSTKHGSRKHGSGKDAWASFAALGFVLGLGYLAKAAMFPLAFVFLAAAALLAGSFRRALPRLLLASAIFGLICAPLVVALSRSKGRLTFGDSGAINYAEFVNGVLPHFDHWQGGPPGTGIPLHPTRKVSMIPAVFEFGTPIPGSYPPWYDPSYWYDGVQTHFSLREQARAVLLSLKLYLRMFSRSGALYFVLLALAILLKKSGTWGSGRRRYWAVRLPCFAALGMYALVNVEARYISWAGLMLLLMVFAGVRLRVPPQDTAAAPGAPGIFGAPFFRTPGVAITVALVIAPVIAVAISTGLNIAAIARPAPFEAWNVAQGMQRMGVPPGSGVGFIGIGLNNYWAHLAGVRIVAEIPDWGMDKFWSGSPEIKSQTISRFAASGAGFVVTKSAPPEAVAQGWKQIAGTSYSLWEIHGPIQQTSAKVPSHN